MLLIITAIHSCLYCLPLKALWLVAESKVVGLHMLKHWRRCCYGTSQMFTAIYIACKDTVWVMWCALEMQHFTGMVCLGDIPRGDRHVKLLWLSSVSQESQKQFRLRQSQPRSVCRVNAEQSQRTGCVHGQRVTVGQHVRSSIIDSDCMTSLFLQQHRGHW